MADRKCGNCKHFSSCSGVNADDVPENMMCNDFEAAPAAGGKDIGEKAEGSKTASETKAVPSDGETTTITRRKATPAEGASGKEVPPPFEEVDDDMPPADDDPGMPPADDDMPPAEAHDSGEEIDNDWDVFGSKVMSRYIGPKAARLVVEAEKAGIVHDGMKPSEMHEALLRWKAEQDAQDAQAAGQSFDDALPPEDVPVVKQAPAPVQEEVERKRKVCAEVAPTHGYVAVSAPGVNPLARHALIGLKSELEKQIVVLQRQVVALDLVIENM